MTKSVFNTYSRYYDLLYRDKDYAAEVDYIDRLLKRHGVKGSELLEFGSGTGKHGRLLAQRGYKVMGIERSADMVTQAEQVDGFQCQVSDISTVQLGRTYDAVLSLFHVISYQVSNEDVLAVFARAAEHLKSGGLFIFDVWYSPAVCTQHPSVRVKRLERDGIRITRIAEPVINTKENRVDVNYQIFAQDQVSGTLDILSESHPMRHFSLPELDLLAQISGFERAGEEEFLTGKELSEETWGVCLILKKI